MKASMIKVGNIRVSWFAPHAGAAIFEEFPPSARGDSRSRYSRSAAEEFD
jgi:hypothetical protein